MDIKSIKKKFIRHVKAPYRVLMSCRYFSRIIIFLIAISSLYCAKIGHPTGGPKDIIPPVLTESTPKNFSTNFSEKKFILFFDEFVQINTLASVIHVSPPMKEKPEFKLKGKSLLVEFKDTLRENTTYTLNFGNGIADLNEANALQNFTYVFATGPKIDSLMVSGTLMDALTNAPVENIQVMLFESTEDSAPVKDIPFYTSKTDKSGAFSLKNLKSGAYKIFALKDANNNLKFDLANEKIAFHDSLVEPQVFIKEKTDTLKRKDLPDSVITKIITEYKPSNIRLLLFEEDHKKLYLANSERPEKNKCIILFSRSVPELPELKPLNFSPSENWYVIEKNKASDTLVYWITDTVNTASDSLKIAITHLRTDSTGCLSLVIDTLQFTYKPKVLQKTMIPVKPSIKTKINVAQNGSLDFNQSLKIELSAPIARFDTNKIVLYSLKDSMGTYCNYVLSEDTGSFKKMETNNRYYQLSSKWEEGEQYFLQLYPGAFTDIYGHTNDTIALIFKLQKKDYYGTLVMKMKNITSPVILQMLDSKETVLDEKFLDNDQDIKYEFLKPSKYKMKIIFDENKNGKWDTGKYFEKRQPEKTIYFSGEINVRSNWDMEQEWE